MDQQLQQVLKTLVAGTAEAVQASLQAWSVLQNTNTTRLMTDSLLTAPPFSSFFTDMKPDEVTEEDEVLATVASSSILEHRILRWPDFPISSMPENLRHDCYKPQSIDWWNHHNFPVKCNDRKFQTIFNLPVQLCSDLVWLLYDDLCQGPVPLPLAMSIKNRVLTVEKQVTMAILRFSTRMTMLKVSMMFDCGKSKVANVVKKFIFSMQKRAARFIQWPDPAEAKHIKEGFRQKTGLVNCCGVVDATRVKLELPYNESLGDWYSQEDGYCMFVQAILDEDGRFIGMHRVARFTLQGRIIGELGIFLAVRMESLCGPLVLMGRFKMREYVVEDGRYPLLPWLMVPWPGQVSEEQRTFNYKVEMAWGMVDRAFEKLKAKWQLLGGKIKNPNMEMLPRTILACCMLHNMVEGMEVGEGDNSVGEVMGKAMQMGCGLEEWETNAVAYTSRLALTD